MDKNDKNDKSEFQSNDTREKGKLLPNREVKANFISQIFFCWLFPLFMTGYKRDLQLEDLYEVAPEDEAKKLVDQLEKEWFKEVAVCKEKAVTPFLTRALRRMFGRSLGVLGIIVLFEESIKIAQAVFMGSLIRYFRFQATIPTWQAYLYAVLIAVCAIVFAMFHHLYFYKIIRIGMQMRIACSGLIFRKVTPFLHYIWVAPMALMAYLGLLIYEMGPSGLAGFFALALLLPFQAVLARIMGNNRRRIAAATDRRVGIMSEILAGIRVIKMYAWEEPFTEVVKEIRSDEVRKLMKTALVGGTLMGTYFATVQLAVFFAVLAYVLTGNPVNAESVFVASALLNSARLSVSLFLPLALQFLYEARVSSKRIQDYLLLEEVSLLAITDGVLRQDGAANGVVADVFDKEPHHVYLTAVSAKWDPEESNKILEDIDLQVNDGELLAIVGPVGSGKSSILYSILGETKVVSGKVDVQGRIAYVPQEAWIFSASLRDNVIFGKDFSSLDYQRALQASALKKDLEVLVQGDQTIVGDRGVQLSGGQRARVNLARAIYYDADIYLLDDPLSAVDSVVGRHIFEKCIMGHLKNTVRILVTHQLQWLKQCTKIIVLKDGKIRCAGTFDELQRRGAEFTDILRETEESYLKRQISKESGQGSPTKVVNSPLFDVQASPLSPSRRRQISRSDKMSTTESERLLSDSADSPARKRSASNASSMWSIASAVGGEGAAVPEEERRIGAVSWHVYYRYFRAMAPSGCLVVLMMIFFCFVQVLFNFCDYWLTIWTNQVDMDARLEANMTSDDVKVFGRHTFKLHSQEDYLYVYLGLVIALIVFSVGRTMLFRGMQTMASQNLHNAMFKAIIRSRVSFFDVNPQGRILNRFAKDMTTMDEMLLFVFVDFFQGTLQFVGIVVVVGVLNPWIFALMVPLSALFLFLRYFYLQTSRDIKRLESMTRSPVFSHISATLNGLPTIRAFSAQHATLSMYYNYMNEHIAAFGLFLSTSRWFGLVIDWLAAAFVTFVAVTSVLTVADQTAGNVGLQLFYGIAFLGAFQWTIRQSAETETMMVSVERVVEYTKLESEPPLEIEPAVVDSSWPSKGEIKLEHVTLRYSPDGPCVLQDITCTIKAGERVGIVGRTGAGKSSLLAALFRLREPEGSIVIDGIDIKTLGLHTLRKAMSIIPQDPVLFIGSLRKNLDPFMEHTDEALWTALTDVELKDVVSAMPAKLESPLQEGGANLSVGQKQLVCLARALLRQSRILVIDEATANVDTVTDSLIQKTIRERFERSTVLTIAHRLDTIMDYDKVMVLQDGCLKEFDHPHLLVEAKDSLLSNFVAETGQAASKLRQLAYESYMKTSRL